MIKRVILSSLSLLLVLGSGCGNDSSSSAGDTGPDADSGKQTKKIAFLTNNTAGFWQIAKAGIQKAEGELGVKVDFKMPPNGTVAEQQEYLENYIAQRYDAVAISPIDAENMTPFLNKVGKEMALFTHDSDAPKSTRLAYIGTNNYKAGRALGEKLAAAFPEGGKMALFVGNLNAQNAVDRRQGILDVLKEKGVALNEAACRLDETDRARAKQNVEEVIASIQDITVLVGLYSYNGPMIASALKNSGKVGQIKAMCFDEDQETLRAIEEGTIELTVVQQPFEFGYQSTKLMLDYLNKGDSALPENAVLDIPVRVIDKDAVKDFAAMLKELTGG
jgi:ribose transport system substrate-binding protein